MSQHSSDLWQTLYNTILGDTYDYSTQYTHRGPIRYT